jgi:hypothetical protein
MIERIYKERASTPLPGERTPRSAVVRGHSLPRYTVFADFPRTESIRTALGQRAAHQRTSA